VQLAERVRLDQPVRRAQLDRQAPRVQLVPLVPL
jgi:hypothetical protein